MPARRAARRAVTFHSPVDTRAVNPAGQSIVGYRELIRFPMNLLAVKAKLKRRDYASPAAFKHDVNLVFINSMRYNKESAPALYLLAYRLNAQFNGAFAAEGIVMGGPHPGGGVDRAERRRLEQNLYNLPEATLGRVVQYLAAECPGALLRVDGQPLRVTIDVDRIDVIPFRVLEAHVLSVLPGGEHHTPPEPPYCVCGTDDVPGDVMFMCFSAEEEWCRGGVWYHSRCLPALHLGVRHGVRARARRAAAVSASARALSAPPRPVAPSLTRGAPPPPPHRPASNAFLFLCAGCAGGGMDLPRLRRLRARAPARRRVAAAASAAEASSSRPRPPPADAVHRRRNARVHRRACHCASGAQRGAVGPRVGNGRIVCL